MLGRTNPRCQIGYITVGLIAHNMLDDNEECKRRVLDSLRNLLDHSYVGQTEFRDLVFTSYQEYDCLIRVLGKKKMTLADLIVAIELGRHHDFFLALAKQAILDAEYRTCQVPPGVRTLVRNLS